MLVELARLPLGQRLSAQRLGETLAIPQPFARRIVSELAAAGLVDTQRGAGGGVGLARPARSITLDDVVTAVEGGVFLNACMRDPRMCGLSQRCQAHVAWQRAGVLLSSYLAECDLASLAAGHPPEASPAHTSTPADNGPDELDAGILPEARDTAP